MITRKDMLTVMPVICHRKALFLVAFNAIMITLLATSCQSLTTGRTVQDMHNPRIATDKCGRQGVISSVCDPDGVILHGEGLLYVTRLWSVCAISSTFDQFPKRVAWLMYQLNVHT